MVALKRRQKRAWIVDCRNGADIDHQNGCVGRLCGLLERHLRLLPKLGPFLLKDEALPAKPMFDHWSGRVVLLEHVFRRAQLPYGDFVHNPIHNRSVAPGSSQHHVTDALRPPLSSQPILRPHSLLNLALPIHRKDDEDEPYSANNVPTLAGQEQRAQERREQQANHKDTPLPVRLDGTRPRLIDDAERVYASRREEKVAQHVAILY
jgi:hypothetical protein